MPPLVSSLLLMKLKEGVYENLISDRLLDDMRQTEASGYVCHTESMDTAESAKMLADFVSDAIRRKLEDADVPVEDKIEMTNSILESVDIDEDEKLSAVPELLSAVVSGQREAALRATKKR